MELVADDGATVITDTVLPRQPYTKVAVVVDGQPVRLIKLEATELKLKF